MLTANLAGTHSTFVLTLASAHLPRGRSGEPVQSLTGCRDLEGPVRRSEEDIAPIPATEWTALVKSTARATKKDALEAANAYMARLPKVCEEMLTDGRYGPSSSES